MAAVLALTTVAMAASAPVQAAISNPALSTGQPSTSALDNWSTPANLYAASDWQGTGYAYAPSVIAGSSQYIYTCHSRSSGYIRDDIFLTKRSGGVIQSDKSVLRGSSSWDSYHNCDPSVVRVNVPYRGHTYSYAMFYLGNDIDASAHNQVGVAVADSLDGPWRKLPDPLVAYSRPGNTEWGAGQPTATTIDPVGGSVVLCWTEGYNTGTVAKFARVDFGSGTPVLSQQHLIPTAGLTDQYGQPDFTHNFDLVYSPARDRFFMVREGHPFPQTSPNYISDHVQVASIAGGGLWSGNGIWTNEGAIDTSLSGRARTHNAGFERTIYGTLPNESQLTVVYTTADLDPGSLWSYRLWQTTAAINSP